MYCQVLEKDGRAQPQSYKLYTLLKYKHFARKNIYPNYYNEKYIICLFHSFDNHLVVLKISL